MGSRFKGVEQGPSIEVFQLMKLFAEDKNEKKVDLSVGAYRDESGKPWVLPVVRKMEKQMAADDTLLHEYLPVLGLDEFSSASVSMLLGEDSSAIATYWTKNHQLVFLHAGFSTPRTYRYWDNKTRSLDLDGMIADLCSAPENSVVILHACAHNPTGTDPSQCQWPKIANVMEERKLFPFFDSAYQGFASGDLDTDAWAVRYFVKRGFELLCAQSYAKNFGLYNERVGNLAIVLKNSAHVEPVRSQVTWIVRGMYSNPPAHGARIVANVLADKQLFDEWKGHIMTMSTRVSDMREALRAELIKLGTPGNWDHIVKQNGLFSCTGLTSRQVNHLVQACHIYLLKSGRINICGLNPSNVGYVAGAMHEAITKHPEEK